nr:hypothetical protein [Tanacetum cinerariifolium]
RTMDTTIDQQVAMDEALVPHAKRLRIRRSNFCMLSDIKSKESALKLVYDVLRLCPFFKAFLVTANVLEIYMQEFWVTATVHHHAIRFKMDNKKHIVNLESFRDMLYICPRVPGQSFVEPPFKEEILAFIRFLGHSAMIKKLIDVNINKLYQPWRSFAAIINKCITEKSSGYDSIRLSQAQILNDWDLLFQPLFDELLNPSPSVDNQDAEVIAPIAELIPQVADDSTGSPSSTIVDQDAPSPSKFLTPTEIQSLVILQDVGNDNLDIEVAHMGNDPLLSVPITIFL